MKTRQISNNDDVIDSRDVIARIEELESELVNVIVHTTCRHCGCDIEGSAADDEWRDRGNNRTCPDDDHEQQHEPVEGTEHGQLPEDEADELQALQALAWEADDHTPDWEHGATLIRESHFADYCQQNLEDDNCFPPFLVIDWAATADNLGADYAEVDFDGVTYFIHY